MVCQVIYTGYDSYLDVPPALRTTMAGGSVFLTTSADGFVHHTTMAGGSDNYTG
jgi:hypothetical protein